MYNTGDHFGMFVPKNENTPLDKLNAHRHVLLDYSLTPDVYTLNREIGDILPEDFEPLNRFSQDDQIDRNRSMCHWMMTDYEKDGNLKE